MTMHRLILGVLASGLVAPTNAQTWSPFQAPGAPVEQVTGSALGLLSAGYSQNTMTVREYDGTTWLQRNPTSTPPPRSEFVMGYDSVRQRVVLFGGCNGPTHYSDTWEWTGSNWQPSVTFSFPPPRAFSRMAFDSARSRMVLFGGSDNAGVLGDTWEYSAPNWIAVQPVAGSPPARVDHAMAFDPIRQRTVLFGGRTWSGPGPLGDTWDWDGSTWTHRSPPSQPLSRSQHGLCFDPQDGGVLLFGGMSSNFNPTFFNDAYVWNGTNWVQRTYYITPTPRSGHAMVLDAVHQTLIVLGGYNGGLLTDGWVFPGTIAAVAQAFGSGCGSLTLAATQPPILGQLAQALLSRSVGSVSLAFMGIGLSETSIGPFALPLPLAGYGLNGCNLYHDLAITAFANCTLAAPNQATYSLGIPNVPAMSGMQFYLQGWVPDQSAPGGLVTSNALRLVLGNF